MGVLEDGELGSVDTVGTRGQTPAGRAGTKRSQECSVRRTREQSHHHWLPRTYVCIYADRSCSGTLRRGKDHTVDGSLSRSMAALCDVWPDALSTP